jgi:hypothetical protein
VTSSSHADAPTDQVDKNSTLHTLCAEIALIKHCLCYFDIARTSTIIIGGKTIKETIDKDL